MLIVGLTGGIATGKSSISHFVSTLKRPVVDADLIARGAALALTLEIVVPGSVAYHLIVDNFGDEILNSAAAIGNIIFNSAEQRKVLNSITHPRIRLVLLQRVLWNFLVGNSMVVLDTPLLFEAGLYRWVHTTIVVYCPPAKQLERLMSRDGISETQAKAKMDSQMSIEQKKTLAHHIIDNSGSLAESRRQTEFLMRELSPSTISVLLMWIIFFWPALWLYALLRLYAWFDRVRYVGLFIKRPIPQVIGR
ncbi:hypothetical protein HDV03_003441 [Kappamyces sp. JEL0829]|nr:hypothetical protein HDV03_003441 [Kappamyces sp. JEL0829]